MTAPRGRARLVARRALAYALDCALLAGLVVATQLGLRLALGAGFPALTTGPEIEAWVFATVSVPVWVYFAGFERSRWQATPAKRLLGLRVASLHGGAAGWPQALVRTVLKLAPWELTHLALLLPRPIWETAADPRPLAGLWSVYGLLALYLLCALLTPRGQAPHDLVARTVVVTDPTD
jgi:uncharacterized RDD family membrane protein YckC